jgi:hypothetical protein
MAIIVPVCLTVWIMPRRIQCSHSIAARMTHGKSSCATTVFASAPALG